MREIFATNLLGTTDVIHYALSSMQAQELRDGWRGQIVIVTSVVARRGPPYYGAYAATKCAQLGIAEALRVELGPAKIGVTSVHPMATDTEFFEVAQSRGGHRHRTHGLEVRQSPQQVARAIVQGHRQADARSVAGEMGAVGHGHGVDHAGDGRTGTWRSTGRSCERENASLA